MVKCNYVGYSKLIFLISHCTGVWTRDTDKPYLNESYLPKAWVPNSMQNIQNHYLNVHLYMCTWCLIMTEIY